MRLPTIIKHVAAFVVASVSTICSTQNVDAGTSGSAFRLHPGEHHTIPVPYPYSYLRVEAVAAMQAKGYTHGDSKANWGINMTDVSGRTRLTVRIISGIDPYDATFSRPYMRVVVDSLDTAGTAYRIADRQLYDELEIMNGANGLRMECGDGYCRVSVGNRNPIALTSFPWPVQVSAATLCATCQTDVKYTDLSAEPAHPGLPQCGWDTAELSDYLSTAQGITGIWDFLDRDTNALFAEPGGSYRLAIVPHRHTADCGCHSATDAGGVPRNSSDTAKQNTYDTTVCDTACDAIYDVIYLGGARAYADRWRSGYLKGRLYPTGFEGHFRLLWFDAETLSAGDELTADFTYPALITFHFPLLKSHLRFSRTR